MFILLATHFISVVKTDTKQEKGKIRVYDPTFLRDLLKAANITVEDANLEIGPTGIRVASMDPSHETMVSLFIPCEAFDAYDVEVPFTVCFNVKEALTILFGKGNRSLKDVDLGLVFKEDVIEAEVKKNRSKQVKTIRLMEPLEEETPEPRISYKAKADMTLKALKQVIEDCTVSELFKVTAACEGIRFTCTDGEDWLEENYLEKDADELLRLTVEGTQKAQYRVKNFKGFMKGLRPLTDTVTLEYSEDMPMKLTAWLPWVNAQLVYYSAPKIIEEPQEEAPVEEPQAIEPQEEAPVEEPQEEPQAVEAPVYQFYMDPGHGWLKVPIKDLVVLGIAGKITRYSYVKGKYAYLEEDCDAPLFIKALKERNQEPRIEDHTANSSSSIRGYQPYRPEDYREEEPQEEAPIEEPISYYQALEDLGFFAYSGEDGDLYRKQGLGGWRVQVYWGTDLAIHKKVHDWAGTRWITGADFDKTHGEDKAKVMEFVERWVKDPSILDERVKDYNPITLADIQATEAPVEEELPECYGTHEIGGHTTCIECPLEDDCERDTPKGILEEEPQAIEDIEDFEGLDLSPEERQALTTMYDNYMIDVFGREDQLKPEEREQLINQDLAAEIFPEGTPVEEETITEETPLNGEVTPLKGDYQARCAAACAAVDEIYRLYAGGEIDE